MKSCSCFVIYTSSKVVVIVILSFMRKFWLSVLNFLKFLLAFVVIVTSESVLRVILISSIFFF